MKDERTIKVLGETKKKFSIYVLVLSIIIIIIKVRLNKGFYIIDSLTELLALIGIIIAYITEPKEEGIDERVENNINNHYNKAFKLIFPITLISYILSVILTIKFNIPVYLSPNFFINSFLFVVFIGVIYLVRKHKIYLNDKFIDNNKSDYFFNVFAYIGIIFIITIAAVIISLILDLIIPGASSSIVLLIALGISFVNISIQYLIYSVYEYNHYKESIDINRGRIPIVTRNMFLFYGIYTFFSVIILILVILSYQYMIKQTEVLALIFLNKQTLEPILLINSSIISIVIVYSLKHSLLRLKNHSKKLINFLVRISLIYIIYSTLNSVFQPIIINYINRLIEPPHFDFLSNISMGLTIISFIMSLIISITGLVYIFKYKLPYRGVFIILLVISIFNIYFNFWYSNNLTTKPIITIRNRTIINMAINLIVSLLYFIIINKYRKSYEIIEYLEEENIID